MSVPVPSPVHAGLRVGTWVLPLHVALFPRALDIPTGEGRPASASMAVNRLRPGLLGLGTSAAGSAGCHLLGPPQHLLGWPGPGLLRPAPVTAL